MCKVIGERQGEISAPRGVSLWRERKHTHTAGITCRRQLCGARQCERWNTVSEQA